MGRIGRDNECFEMILHRGEVYTPDPDDLKDQRTEIRHVVLASRIY